MRPPVLFPGFNEANTPGGGRLAFANNGEHSGLIPRTLSGALGDPDYSHSERCEMAEKVVFVLFVQITALNLIVTPTSAGLAEVDGGAAPQAGFRYQISQAQATSTDDDLRAILATSGMPYLFKNLCASFRPPLKLSPENVQKYVLAKLSDNPEAIDRISG